MLTNMPATPPAPAPDQDSPGSPYRSDPERTATLRRELRGLALALFSWTMREPDPGHSTAQERLLARAIRPWLPRLRDALLSRLDQADGPALEAMMGASASALESMIFYAPGVPLPRFVWRITGTGIALVPLEDGGSDPSADGS